MNKPPNQISSAVKSQDQKPKKKPIRPFSDDEDDDEMAINMIRKMFRRVFYVYCLIMLLLWSFHSIILFLFILLDGLIIFLSVCTFGSSWITLFTRPLFMRCLVINKTDSVFAHDFALASAKYFESIK